MARQFTERKPDRAPVTVKRDTRALTKLNSPGASLLAEKSLGNEREERGSGTHKKIGEMSTKRKSSLTQNDEIHAGI